MTNEMKIGLATIEMIVLAIYNKPSEFIKGVYGLPDAQGAYFEEKMKLAINNFGRWWGNIDSTHRISAIETAERMYGDEARLRIGK